MIMNTNDFYNAAIKLVKNGIVSEVLIDEAIKRILNVKFKLGLFDAKKRRGYISTDVIA
ncbi:hypothetical protein [Clostridium sp.]|uniref:hypothetical protein n=1 Tax=Clostridium sp. TaxID=1506 RepID=UPI003FD81B6F